MYYTLPKDLHLSNRTLCKCGTVHISKETDKGLKAALKPHYGYTPEFDSLPNLEELEDDEENDETEFENEGQEEAGGLGSASSHFPFVHVTALPKERPRNLQGDRYIILPDPQRLRLKPPLNLQRIAA